MAKVAGLAAALPPEELAGDDRVEAIEAADGMTYVEDWSKIDREIDEGRRVRFLDDPAVYYFGSEQVLVAQGLLGCRVCWEHRPEGVTCCGCLRTGDEDLPRTHPRAPLASKIRFRGKHHRAAKRKARELEPAA